MKKRIFFFVLVVLVLLAVMLGRFWKQGIWDGRSQLNLVLLGSSVAVFGFDPQEPAANLLLIPSETLVEATHGYGFYRAEKIWALDQLDAWGGELAKESFQEFLGVVIDGFLVVEMGSEPQAVLSALLSSLRQNPKTDLKKSDLLRLWWQLRKMRKNKLNLISLERTEAFSPVSLADGSQAFQIDPERLEEVVGSFFKDKKIVAEDLAVAILNATNHDGLANRASRLVSHLGSRVVVIGKAEPATAACDLRASEAVRKTYTVQKLIQIFHCQEGGQDLAGQRAEVVLILGEAFWQRLNEK